MGDSNNKIDKKGTDALRHTLELNPNTPLWQRVPTKDETGKYLGDFMMIIPKLKTASSEHQRKTLNALNCVLTRYQDVVVFADLNLKMNLLWISIKPKKGMFAEIPAAIIESVPEAKLISERPPK
jgi:hypothetical protein